MIKVHIKNYQLVKDLVFEIDGFTSIQGSSNRGKSSIARSISSALKNDNGEDFIRHGHDFCEVEFTFPEDNLKFKWIKKRGSGGYYVLNDDYDNPFNALTGKVPEFVAELGGIDSVEIKSGASSDKYFPQICSDQHGTLFLIGDSDPVKTELIADLAEVTKITKALKLLKKKAKSTNSELSTRKKDLKVFNLKWDAIKDLDIEKDYRELESIVSTIESHDIESAKLAGVKSRYLASSKLCSILSDIPEIDLSSLDKLGIEELRELLSLKTRHENVGLVLEKLEDIPELVIPENVDEILSLLQKLGDLSSRYKKSEKLLLIDVPEVKIPDVEDILEEALSLSRLKNSHNRATSKMLVLSDIDSINIETPPNIDSKLEEIARLMSLKERYTATAKLLESLDQSSKDLEMEIRVNDLELSKFDNCPLCGMEFGEMHSHA